VVGFHNDLSVSGPSTMTMEVSSLILLKPCSGAPSSRFHAIARWFVLIATANLLLASGSLAAPLHQSAQLASLSHHWGLPSDSLPTRIAIFRGGSSVEQTEEEDEYDDEEYDSDEEEEEDVDEEEDEDEEEEEEEAQEDDTSGVQIEVKVEKYDDPLVAPAMANLFASLGVMLLGKKVDLFSPTIVRIGRTAFITYLVVHQIFLLYVRIQARKMNDRTPIELKSPLTSVLQSQMGDGGNGMMKNLASSFLASKSTVLEYDLKQSRSMQSGIIFNMVTMWVLHFKMGQVQPLLIQSVTGFVTMVYSPLFQIYVMGLNLERPFKGPAGPLEAAQEESAAEIEGEDAGEVEETAGAEDTEASTITEDEDDDEEADSESEDEDDDEEDEDEENDDDDSDDDE
jgi:hypothetical protein